MPYVLLGKDLVACLRVEFSKCICPTPTVHVRVYKIRPESIWHQATEEYTRYAKCWDFTLPCMGNTWAPGDGGPWSAYRDTFQRATATVTTQTTNYMTRAVIEKSVKAT